jgi:hypothetical protein
MILKLPPFGKPLKDLLLKRTPPTNSIYLYIGEHAWKKGRNAAHTYAPDRTLILPPGDSPKLYYWPVFNLDILIIDTSGCDESLIESLMDELMKYGAEVVRYISWDGKMTAVYKRN